ncbi:MAG: hypothetical protein AB7U73_23015 [Pirellulales bacterium]
MRSNWNRRRGAWFAGGAMFGFAAAALLFGAGVWPHTPLHATATDRYENFAIATGPLDENVEAVFFLDFISGDLKAAVLSPQFGRFNAMFARNILNDLGVDPTQNPHYLMVTGVANLRRSGGGQFRPSASVVYVAELTTGKIAAYSVPWRPDIHNAGAPFQGQMILLDVAPFREVVVRDQE